VGHLVGAAGGAHARLAVLEQPVRLVRVVRVEAPLPLPEREGVEGGRAATTETPLIRPPLEPEREGIEGGRARSAVRWQVARVEAPVFSTPKPAIAADIAPTARRRSFGYHSYGHH
jgi:hypothetical protein